MYQRKVSFNTDLKQAANPGLAEAKFQELLEKHHGEIDMAEVMAANPACPFKLYAEFWRYQVSTVKNNPNMEQHQLNQYWHNAAIYPVTVKYNKWSNGIDRSQPESHRARYLIEHGDGQMKKFVMSLDLLHADMITTHAAGKDAFLRKVIAARETMPPAVAEKLSKDSAKGVRLALAGNKDAPADVLAGLAFDRDEAVADAARENPSCPRDAINKAKLADRDKPAVQRDELNQWVSQAAGRSCPVDVLEQYAQHDNPCVRFMVGFNPATPPRLLSKISKDELDWVKAGAAFNPATPREDLVRMLDSKSRDIRIGLASNPSLSEQDQLKLAADASQELQQVLVNLTLYVSVWEKLAEGVDIKIPAKDKRWRHFLAEALKARANGKFSRLERNPNSRWLFVSRIAARAESCPEDMLSQYAYYLFEDYSQNPLAALALLEGRSHVSPRPYQAWKIDKWMQEGNAPAHVTRYFIRSEDAKRRMQALSNWNAQIVDTIPFVLDPDTNTRKRLADRLDLIRFQFEMLIRDQKSTVREVVTKNRKLPRSLFKAMSADQSVNVRATAQSKKVKKSGGSVDGLANQGKAADRIKVAKKTRDLKILADLATDKSAGVRRAVVENYYVSQDIITSLVADKDEKVRLTVAQKCRDKQLVLNMLSDSSPEVRLTIARARRWRHYESGKPIRLDREVCQSMAQNDDPEVRAEAARYIEDIDIIHTLSQDPSVIVSRALAANRLLTEDIRQQMVKRCDDDETMAEIARFTQDEAIFLDAAEKMRSSHCDTGVTSNWEMLCRQTVQDRLCKHPVLNVRYWVAMTPNLSEFAKNELEVLLEEYGNRKASILQLKREQMKER